MVISFLSYKGGVGRSLALANVATCLSLRGHQVVCVDLDIEAPSLHIIFGKEQRDVSLLDIFIDKRPDLLKDALVNIESFDSRKKRNGRLMLLPSTPAIEKIDSVDWKTDGEDIFCKIINSLRDMRYDYVLIDARSGFTAGAGISIPVSNLSLIFSRLHKQSAEGTRLTIDACRVASVQFKIIAAQVPNTRTAKKYIKNQTERLGIEAFAEVLPYDDKVACEDAIVVGRRRISQLAGAYERLADMIENGE